METIRFTVVKQRLMFQDPRDVFWLYPTSDTVNYYRCEFTFDETWDGFEKRIYFKNASYNITKGVLLDASNRCFIPWEVLAHSGAVICSLVGVKYSNETVIERLTTNQVQFMVQHNESVLEPYDQQPLTPTEYEQFRGHFDDVYTATVAAMDAAIEAEQNAEAVAEDVSGYVTQAQEYSSDSEAYATGIRNGEAVGVDDPTYHNNAKYYSQQAYNSMSTAVQAKEDAVDAKADAINARVDAETAEYNANSAASDAEAFAKGTRGGTPVSSGDQAYHNNAKYYSDQAANSATSSANARDSSIASSRDSEAYAIGKRNGSAVAADDPAYHNNAKYYSDQTGVYAYDSEAYAIGKRNGVDVTSDDPAYHNNSKYWKDQSQAVSVTLIGDMANVYDNTSIYNTGDLVLYQNQLYKCNTDITVAEDWTAAHWDAIVIGDALEEMELELEDIDSILSLKANTSDVVPNTRKVNNKALSADITLDYTDVSAVPTSRKVNNKALSSDITLDPSDVGAVPTSRTVNGKALTSDISLDYSDVSAVPITRKVNEKALSGDITLDADDIGYDETETYSDDTVGKELQTLLGYIEQAFPTDTSSGDIASFPDGSNLFPLKKCEVTLEPIQDLHGYDAPWVGGGGKNKFDKNYLSDFDNYTTTSGGYKYTDKIQLKANTDYIIKATDLTALSSGLYFVLYHVVGNDADVIQINSGTIMYPVYNGDVTSSDLYQKFTTGETGVIRFGAANATALAEIMTKNYQLEEGNTATSWTPYSNICPISGRSSVDLYGRGFNLWDEEWEVGALNSDGSINTSQTNRRTTSFIPIIPNTNYYLVCPTTSVGGRYCFYDADKAVVEYNGDGFSSHSFTSPANAYYVKWTLYTSYGTTYNNDISINYPSTDHGYHAYNGTTYTIPLGQAVYGGDVEVVSGTLFDGEEWGEADMGDLSWSYVSTDTYPAFYCGINGMDRMSLDVVVQCEAFKAISGKSGSNFRTNDYEGCIANITDQGDGTTIGIQCSLYTDAPSFKNAMRGYKLIYKKKTPTPISITPTQISTLYGQNNIFSDSGDTEVTYKADTQLWVVKKLAEVNESIDEVNTAILALS